MNIILMSVINRKSSDPSTHRHVSMLFDGLQPSLVSASDWSCSMSLNARFGMKRRDMMKLTSLVMLPMMPGVAMASSDNKGLR